MTSVIFQGSLLGHLLLPSYASDVFDVIWNGVRFVFADDHKIVYSFFPKALECPTRKTSQGLASRSSWATDNIMKISAENSSIMGFRCATKLKIPNQVIPVRCQVCDLDLNYAWTLNFSECALAKIAKANRLVGLPHRTEKLKESKLHRFITNVRLILEFCSLVCSTRMQCNGVAIEKDSHTFTKQMNGHSANLNYMDRRESPKSGLLRLRRTRANLVLFSNITTENSCILTTRVRNPLHNSLRKMELIITFPVTKPSVRANILLINVHIYQANSSSVCASNHYHL